MALTLLFLGRLEDAAGGAERALEVEAPLSLSRIVERLEPELSAQLTSGDTKIALNGVLVAGEGVAGDGWRAGDGDELAFLPPVSGG